MNDNELNKALEQLAEEVPPMPADFHDRWMNAVRAEADKTAPAAETETRDKTASLVRWTRMLSIAAVFVFLIGGTILYRNSRKILSAPYTVVESAAQPEPEKPVAEEPVAEKEEARVEPVTEEEAEAAAPEAAAEAPEADMAAYEAYGAYEAEEAPVMMAAVPEAPAAEEADLAAEAEEPDRMYSKSASSVNAAANGLVGEAPALTAGKAAETADEAAPVWEDAEAEYEEEAAYEEAAPAPAEAQTAVPTEAPTAVPTEAPTLEPTAEPSGQEKTGFLSEAGAFFTDMGDFLLAALPYLLVLAVPALAAVIIRRREK